MPATAAQSLSDLLKHLQVLGTLNAQGRRMSKDADDENFLSYLIQKPERLSFSPEAHNTGTACKKLRVGFIPQPIKAAVRMQLLYHEATQDAGNFDSLIESCVQNQEDHSQHCQVYKELLPPLQMQKYISGHQRSVQKLSNLRSMHRFGSSTAIHMNSTARPDMAVQRLHLGEDRHDTSPLSGS